MEESITRRRKWLQLILPPQCRGSCLAVRQGRETEDQSEGENKGTGVTQIWEQIFTSQVTMGSN